MVCSDSTLALLPPPQARAVHTKRTASGYAPERRFRVGVLGATGAVGQRFLQHLEGHPWFEVTHLGASERSAGKTYGEATAWHLSADAPAYLKGMRVTACEPAAFAHDVDFVFSALVRRWSGGSHACALLTHTPPPLFSPSHRTRLLPRLSSLRFATPVCLCLVTRQSSA